MESFLPSSGKGGRTRLSALPRRSDSGVALVITLILLSVITFMAITFLVVSRHESAQVDVLQQQSNAKNANASGVQYATAFVIAQMLGDTNGLKYRGLFVSTNWWTNSFGGTTNITDVSYIDSSTGTTNFGTALRYEQMLNNLLVLPRAPVFVYANKGQAAGEFRYFLDLNRNGVAETNGAVVEVDGNGNLVTNIYVGDPEFIGILNHPDQRHSPSNFFIGRVAFIALPIGQSLDVNYIHNQAKQITSDAWANGYMRNQGVGSWELNLAAFLHEVNPNWDNPDPPYGRVAYGYRTNNGVAVLPSVGSSFDDATEILQYRYAGNFNTLRAFRALYGATPAGSLFGNDFIDGYTHGPLMTGLTYPVTADPDVSILKSPWSGDYSTNQYFNTQDLFNSVPYYRGLTANAGTSFSNHLFSIGRNYSSLINSANGSITNSINRYTFYNILKQMSFGSAPEPPTYPFAQSVNPNFFSAYGLNTPKMNLNYVNVGGISETNFIQWSPIQFFTNAADRMLRAYFPNAIGATNDLQGKAHPIFLSLNYIPIYPTNYYTPAVHRVLQLAANMYDAVNTNRYYDQLTPNGPYFPSVFRPIFYNQTTKSTNIIYIMGYQEVTNNYNLTTLPKDLRRYQFDVLKFPQNRPVPDVDVYGIPYVIGARKGFPSFNKFSSIPEVQMWRAMQLDRSQAAGAAYGPTWKFDVRYTFSVTNYLAVECWNPSANIFPRNVTIYASDDYNMVMTNNVGAQPVPGVAGVLSVVTNVTIPNWSGTIPLSQAVFNPSFKDPISNAVVAVPNSYLQASPAKIIAATNSGNVIAFENNTNYYTPTFGFSATNRVRLVMVDTATGRLIDYVVLGGCGQLAGLDTMNNVSNDLATLDPQIWDTTTRNSQGVPNGFNNQVLIAKGDLAPGTNNTWKSLPLGAGENSVPDAMKDFRNWVNNPKPTNLTYQVPLVAFKTYAVLNNTWAANDPLVHYMVSDLTDAAHPPKAYDYSSGGGNPLMDFLNGIPIGQVNSKRCQPWGVTNGNGFTDIIKNQIAYKDPLVATADSWQFPSNKFPNVGWLGRVHRGTPWQTVYLKSMVATNNWIQWTGDTLTNYFNIGNDSAYSQPNSDWLLMDLFTTTPNENASKGQLSINQTNYAAWAAAFDGLLVVTNAGPSPTNITPWVISPNDYYQGTTTNMTKYLVDKINAVRNSYTNQGGAFTGLGQICSVPELSVNSPFLNTTPAMQSSLNDAAYERIPQQMMSLLRLGTPRFVIFSYGQSLKPADHSIVNSGPFFGMCTNYQITGEVATRTVVRIDNYPVPGVPINQFQPRAVVESFTVLGPD